MRARLAARCSFCCGTCRRGSNTCSYLSRGRRVDGVSRGCIFYLQHAFTQPIFYRFLQREPVLNRLHTPIQKGVPPRLVSEHRVRRCMEHRALLLVFGPVLALAGHRTISTHAAALTAAPADQEPRFGGVTSLSTVRADTAPHPWPVLSETRPARDGRHQQFWIRGLVHVLFRSAQAIHVLIKIGSVVFVD